METGFTIVAARARAMMAAANIPVMYRFLVFEQAANWAVKLDWLTVIKIDGVNKTRIEHYGNEIPTWTLHVRTFGEAGTVKIGKNGKLGDRGCTMMYVGHADGHAGDVYRMWNQ